MSFRKLVTALVFLAVFTMAVRVSVDTDSWWHLRAGQWILEEGEIVFSQNPFSTAQFGEPWIYPGWLAQVLFYLIYSELGLPGLNLLTAITVVIAFGFVWQCMSGAPLAKGFVLLLAVSASAVYWSARPQILSFALSGAYLWTLERNYRKPTWTIYLLVPLMALWVNIHGGFAVGFILIGVYLCAAFIRDVVSPRFELSQAGKQTRPQFAVVRILLLVAVLCVAAITLNPHGIQMITYPIKTVSIGVLREYIQEWQSPDFHQLELLPFLVLLLGSGVAMGLSVRKPGPEEILLYLVFGGLALTAGRNIALFGLVAAPILSRDISDIGSQLPRWFRKQKEISPRIARTLNLAILILLLIPALAKVSLPLREAENLRILQDRIPIQAVQVLQEIAPPGPLLNSYNWGGYIIWEMYPDYLSFVDGRTDLFDDEILEEYLQLWRGEEGWEEILERWGFKTVILEPYAPVVRELHLIGWELLYQDDQATILTSPEG